MLFFTVLLPFRYKMYIQPLCKKWQLLSTSICQKCKSQEDLLQNILLRLLELSSDELEVVSFLQPPEAFPPSNNVTQSLTPLNLAHVFLTAYKLVGSSRHPFPKYAKILSILKTCSEEYSSTSFSSCGTKRFSALVVLVFVTLVMCKL